jgi:hypothetical protein
MRRTREHRAPLDSATTNDTSRAHRNNEHRTKPEAYSRPIPHICASIWCGNGTIPQGMPNSCNLIRIRPDQIKSNISELKIVSLTSKHHAREGRLDRVVVSSCPYLGRRWHRSWHCRVQIAQCYNATTRRGLNQVLRSISAA